MRRHIGTFLNRENVERALEAAIERNMNLRKGTRYAIAYKGQEFPPKAIADLAIELEGKIEKEEYYRHGGENQFHKYYKNLGYIIIEKSTGKEKEIVEGGGDDKSRIVRICYNTLDWTEPSGRTGKSKGNHEGKWGYGHEEWMLDLDRTYNGYHYSFIEGVRKHWDSMQGKVYEFRLYTYDSISQRHYWIGRIPEAEVLTVEQADEVTLYYHECGWWNQMEDQVRKVQEGMVGIPKGFSNHQKLKQFNIRFRPESFDFTAFNLQMTDKNPITKYKRYEPYKSTSERLIGYPASPIFAGAENLPGERKLPVIPKPDGTYTRSEGEIQIRYMHDWISAGLFEVLEDHYGVGKVYPEDSTGLGSREVDLVVRAEGKTIFFEIKTHISLSMSIRAAIGQLMEYCHWGKANRANYWVIVTQPHIATGPAEEYLRHIRKKYGLPVHLQTFNYISKELSILLPDLGSRFL